MARKKGKKKGKGRVRAIDLNAIILAEVEKLVTALEKSKSVDKTLLTFLRGHVQRYIIVLRIINGERMDEMDEFKAARSILERIDALRGGKGERVAPENDMETLKRFLEIEDNEMLHMHLTELSAEVEGLRSRVDAEGARGGASLEAERQIEELKRELDINKKKMNALAAKFRELHGRTSSLSNRVKDLLEERGRLANEVVQWRKKFDQWQTTMDQIVEQRARELLEEEKRALSEQMLALKGQTSVLRRIRAGYDIVPTNRAGGVIVIPKSVSMNLNITPGDRLKVDVSGNTVVYRKA